MNREGIFEKHRLDTVIAAFVTGNVAQASLGPVPQGYAWYIENFAFAVLGNSHTTALELAITPDDTALVVEAAWDNAGLVLTMGTGAAPLVRSSAQPGIAWRMGPGHFAHVTAHGGTAVAGDILSVTFQVAVHQLDPAFLMTAEDRQQVAAAHEHVALHQVAEVATASRRAV